MYISAISLILLNRFHFSLFNSLVEYITVFKVDINFSGQIVGAILFNGVAPVESGKMLNVMFTCQPSPRWLAEKEVPKDTKIVQVLLVRRTLAWITGIILIISTLLGVRFTCH